MRKMYRDYKEERVQYDTKLATRTSEIRDWATVFMENQYEDFTKLMNARILESEGKMALQR